MQQEEVVPSRNLELKSRVRDLAAAEQAAQALGAVPQWDKRQTDTYFHVPNGRLKLREADGSIAELIGYDRANDPAARESAYRVVPVADPAALKATLARALGVRVVVVKRRTLYLWHNVRIHLDTVDGLGGFLEFEAVLRTAEDEAASPDRVARLAAALQLREGDRVSGSYSDLLEARSANASL